MTEQKRGYSKVRSAVAGTPWAIRPEKLDAIVEVLDLRAAGVTFTPEEIQARIGSPKPEADMVLLPIDAIAADDKVPAPEAATQQRSRGGNGSIALIPMYGVIGHRVSALEETSGACSLQRFKARFNEALNSADVKAIVVDIDSPGGVSYGVTEMAQLIYEARGTKPMVAVINPLGCSAALWLGTQFPELVITPSGLTGSLGVYMLHEDWSQANEMMGVKPTYIQFGKYKTEGNYNEPLGDEAAAHFQAIVDQTGREFAADVARGRGIPLAKVLSDFGQGRCLLPAEAKAVGMVDRIQTLDQVLSRLGATAGKTVRGPDDVDNPADHIAEKTTPEPMAQDVQEQLTNIARMKARGAAVHAGG